MQLFYTGAAPENGMLRLSAEESRHCKVLRKQPGDQLQVTDGKGMLYRCSLIAMRGDETLLQLESAIEMPPARPYRFHLMIAPTKQNERMEWMLEKAVEIGLDEISFLETERGEKHRINPERLQRIALSAMKQSAQFHLPLIHPLRPVKDLPFTGSVFLAHCVDEWHKIPLQQAVREASDQKQIALLVGPEGDFTEAEITHLLQKGCVPVSLGPTRLRTETAGLFGAAAISAMF